MQEYADQLVASVPDDLEREFELLLLESSKLAFRVAFGVLRHQQDAEDVAQEAFLKAHSHFRRLRDRKSFRAWLVRTSWRLAINRHRDNRRRLNRETSDDDRLTASHAADSILADERANHVWQALDNLPEKLRITIVLSGIEGHEISEIAELLRVPEGTVKSRLFQARARIREELKWMNTSATNR